MAFDSNQTPAILPRGTTTGVLCLKGTFCLLCEIGYDGCFFFFFDNVLDLYVHYSLYYANILNLGHGLYDSIV